MIYIIAWLITDKTNIKQIRIQSKENDEPNSNETNIFVVFCNLQWRLTLMYDLCSC